MAERPAYLGIGRGQPGRASKQTDWRARAACLGKMPDDWYPEQGDSVTAARARRVCREECPVMQHCLAYAIVTNEPDGIFGGCTERERRNVRKGLVNLEGMEWLSRTTRTPVPDGEAAVAGAFMYLGPDFDEVFIRIRRRVAAPRDRQAG